MKLFLTLLFISTTMQTQTLIDFTENSNLNDWKIVDDVVMGGVSSGNFELTDEGHARFYGEVSLKNNGGFSSVQRQMKAVKINSSQKVRLKIKGDGKTYQFRVKHKASDRHSYIAEFKTSGDWQLIDIKLGDMKPQFRGRKLDLPNFDQDCIEQLTFLNGNKKPQEFELFIDSITLTK